MFVNKGGSYCFNLIQKVFNVTLIHIQIVEAKIEAVI